MELKPRLVKGWQYNGDHYDFDSDPDRHKPAEESGSIFVRRRKFSKEVAKIASRIGSSKFGDVAISLVSSRGIEWRSEALYQVLDLDYRKLFETVREKKLAIRGNPYRFLYNFFCKSIRESVNARKIKRRLQLVVLRAGRNMYYRDWGIFIEVEVFEKTFVLPKSFLSICKEAISDHNSNSES
ncbi:MAG: hypothetical protein Q7S34_01065 [bacterium]|nr:hypothetical protein [bacterium]